MDVEITEIIVDRLGLTFQVVEPTLPGDEDEWARLMTRFVRQTDGLASPLGVATGSTARSASSGLKLWGLRGNRATGQHRARDPS